MKYIPPSKQVASLSLGETQKFLNMIYKGQATKALSIINTRIRMGALNAGLMTLKAEALRTLGQIHSAIDSYKKAAELGAKGTWFRAGTLLDQINQVEDAYLCLTKAIEEDPDNPDAYNTMVVMLFNKSRNHQGLNYAVHLLSNPRSSHQQRATAALLLSSIGMHDEASDAFKTIVNQVGLVQQPSLIGPILGSVHFTCDWDLFDAACTQAMSFYAAGQFKEVCEYPLTNISWCTDEAINLAVAQAHALRTIPQTEPFVIERNVPHNRIRIGYISNDFREHATMHLMIGLFENHNKENFEIFAYDYSVVDDSEYRRRFVKSIDHLIDISVLSDLDAAKKIELDHLDILIDLKGYTGLARPGVLAHRPAPIQLSYLGFPGSTGLSYIDYLMTDRYVTPDSSKAHYSERLCRLPHSYQCNEKAQDIALSLKSRDDFGLPSDQVVFCSFNQSYKIDAKTFAVWLQILQGVENSVLWLLVGQSDTAKKNLIQFAEKHGIDPKRLIFASGAMPTEHRERIQFADIALDTLLCNGHTTTSDMLFWAGLPVVTCKGAHFASRVSESLLNTIGLPELVGIDHQDMVRIGCELGNNSDYRKTIREKIAINRKTAALFDPLRFARDFERGLTMIIANHQSDSPCNILDVPAH